MPVPRIWHQTILSFAATYVVQASLIKAVQDVRDGRVDLDLSQTVGAAVPYILPVIGASIVIGGAGVFESSGRSMQTVRGYAWRVFGTYVLVFLILIAFAIVLGFILLQLPLWLRRGPTARRVPPSQVRPGPIPRRAAPSQVRQSVSRLPRRTGARTRHHLRTTPDSGWVSLTACAVRLWLRSPTSG
jgi:hypothetical protein